MGSQTPLGSAVLPGESSWMSNLAILCTKPAPLKMRRTSISSVASGAAVSSQRRSAPLDAYDFDLEPATSQPTKASDFNKKPNTAAKTTEDLLARYRASRASRNDTATASTSRTSHSRTNDGPTGHIARTSRVLDEHETDSDESNSTPHRRRVKSQATAEPLPSMHSRELSDDEPGVLDAPPDGRPASRMSALMAAVAGKLGGVTTQRDASHRQDASQAVGPQAQAQQSRALVASAPTAKKSAEPSVPFQLQSERPAAPLFPRAPAPSAAAAPLTQPSPASSPSDPSPGGLSSTMRRLGVVSVSDILGASAPPSPRSLGGGGSGAGDDDDGAVHDELEDSLAPSALAAKATGSRPQNTADLTQKALTAPPPARSHASADHGGLQFQPDYLPVHGAAVDTRKPGNATAGRQVHPVTAHPPAAPAPESSAARLSHAALKERRTTDAAVQAHPTGAAPAGQCGTCCCHGHSLSHGGPGHIANHCFNPQPWGWASAPPPFAMPPFAAWGAQQPCPAAMPFHGAVGRPWWPPMPPQAAYATPQHAWAGMAQQPLLPQPQLFPWPASDSAALHSTTSTDPLNATSSSSSSSTSSSSLSAPEPSQPSYSSMHGGGGGGNALAPVEQLLRGILAASKSGPEESESVHARPTLRGADASADGMPQPAPGPPGTHVPASLLSHPLVAAALVRYQSVLAVNDRRAEEQIATLRAATAATRAAVSCSLGQPSLHAAAAGIETT